MNSAITCNYSFLFRDFQLSSMFYCDDGFLVERETQKNTTRISPRLGRKRALTQGLAGGFLERILEEKHMTLVQVDWMVCVEGAFKKSWVDMVWC